MPLIKKPSKKALKHNIEVEMDAHPEHREQDLAIAYNVQRQARKKKMAMGGMIPKPGPMSGFEDRYSEQAGHESVADAIMSKRKKYADGGVVDIEDNGEEEGSTPFDDMNEEAVMKELYDDSQLEDQPMDSNEHGDDIEEDVHDMVSTIRKKMKSLRG